MADRASARADGKAVFVPFTLPGEEVEAEIVADKGGFSTAELQSVLEPSPARTQPPCPYFGRCGGCHYQHAIYATQVEMKRRHPPRNSGTRPHSRNSRHRGRHRRTASATAIAFAFTSRTIRSLSVTNSANRTRIFPSPPVHRHPDCSSARSRLSIGKGRSLGLAAFVTEIELFSAPDESCAAHLPLDRPVPSTRQNHFWRKCHSTCDKFSLKSRESASSPWKKAGPPAAFSPIPRQIR